VRVECESSARVERNAEWDMDVNQEQALTEKWRLGSRFVVAMWGCGQWERAARSLGLRALVDKLAQDATRTGRTTLLQGTALCH